MKRKLRFLKITSVILAVSSTAVLFACSPKPSVNIKQTISKNLQDLKLVIERYNNDFNQKNKKSEVGFLSPEIQSISKIIVDGQTNEAGAAVANGDRNADWAVKNLKFLIRKMYEILKDDHDELANIDNFEITNVSEIKIINQEISSFTVFDSTGSVSISKNQLKLDSFNENLNKFFEESEKSTGIYDSRANYDIDKITKFAENMYLIHESSGARRDTISLVQQIYALYGKSLPTNLPFPGTFSIRNFSSSSKDSYDTFNNANNRISDITFFSQYKRLKRSFKTINLVGSDSKAEINLLEYFSKLITDRSKTFNEVNLAVKTKYDNFLEGYQQLLISNRDNADKFLNFSSSANLYVSLIKYFIENFLEENERIFSSVQIQQLYNMDTSKLRLNFIGKTQKLDSTQLFESLSKNLGSSVDLSKTTTSFPSIQVQTESGNYTTNLPGIDFKYISPESDLDFQALSILMDEIYEKLSTAVITRNDIKSLEVIHQNALSNSKLIKPFINYLSRLALGREIDNSINFNNLDFTNIPSFDPKTRLISDLNFASKISSKQNYSLKNLFLPKNVEFGIEKLVDDITNVVKNSSIHFQAIYDFWQVAIGLEYKSFKNPTYSIEMYTEELIKKLIEILNIDINDNSYKLNYDSGQYFNKSEVVKVVLNIDRLVNQRKIFSKYMIPLTFDIIIGDEETIEANYEIDFAVIDQRYRQGTFNPVTEKQGLVLIDNTIIDRFTLSSTNNFEKTNVDPISFIKRTSSKDNENNLVRGLRIYNLLNEYEKSIIASVFHSNQQDPHNEKDYYATKDLMDLFGISSINDFKQDASLQDVFPLIINSTFLTTGDLFKYINGRSQSYQIIPPTANYSYEVLLDYASYLEALKKENYDDVDLVKIPLFQKNYLFHNNISLSSLIDARKRAGNSIFASIEVGKLKYVEIIDKILGIYAQTLTSAMNRIFSKGSLDSIFKIYQGTEKVNTDLNPYSLFSSNKPISTPSKLFNITVQDLIDSRNFNYVDSNKENGGDLTKDFFDSINLFSTNVKHLSYDLSFSAKKEFNYYDRTWEDGEFIGRKIYHWRDYAGSFYQNYEIVLNDWWFNDPAIKA
jgi:hypothetical protein